MFTTKETPETNLFVSHMFDNSRMFYHLIDCNPLQLFLKFDMMEMSDTLQLSDPNHICN